jgi:hypothetical protein
VEEAGFGATETVNSLQPAVALARDASAATVISSEGLAAEVDLASLSVSYHELAFPTPPRGKVELGSTRTADLLPSGTLAVTGYDIRQVERDGQQLQEKTSAGLWLVDSRTWKIREINHYVDSVSVAGNLLLATGWHLNTRTEVSHGIGLNAYTLAGKRRFRLYAHKWVYIYDVYRGRAFVEAEGHRAISIADLRRRRVAGSRNPNTFPLLVTP